MPVVILIMTVLALVNIHLSIFYRPQDEIGE